MRLGLGLFIRSLVGGGGGDPISDMVAAFVSRVTTDGGTIAGTSCLTTILTELNDISWVY